MEKKYLKNKKNNNQTALLLLTMMMMMMMKKTKNRWNSDRQLLRESLNNPVKQCCRWLVGSYQHQLNVGFT